jgi:hypothetical protein
MFNYVCHCLSVACGSCPCHPVPHRETCGGMEHWMDINGQLHAPGALCSGRLVVPHSRSGCGGKN